MHVFLAEGAKHQQLLKWLGNPLLRSAEPETYLRCYESTLQMQIFWHESNEEESEQSSSVAALLQNPDVGLESGLFQ